MGRTLSPPEPPLLGGRPSLDFVNAAQGPRVAADADPLADGMRYLVWAESAGVLAPGERRRIQSAGGVGAADLAGIQRMRDQLRSVFLAIAQDRAPDPDTLVGLDRWLQHAWRARTLVARRGGVALGWREEALDAFLPIRRIALDALDLALNAPRGRLKLCAATATTGCGRLFLDDTRNGSRRWCSMAGCGGVDKMRRYRAARSGRVGDRQPAP